MSLLERTSVSLLYLKFDFFNFFQNLLCTCIIRVANIWDIRAGRQMHKFLGHSKWIR